jgi:TRAP-type C4-dicarboxylate transport system permease large subunit
MKLTRRTVLSRASIIAGGVIASPAILHWPAYAAEFTYKCGTAVPGGRWGFLAVTIVAFIVLGSVLEGLPAIVLFGPLLFPIAKAMGVHEVHYAMVVILAMGIGLFAPPFGVGFFGACAIGRTNPNDAIWRIWPYIGALVVSLLVVAAIPWLSIGFL